MGNTIGTGTYGSSWREKYAQSTLQQVLRKALIAEKICTVDRSDIKYIQSPYIGQPTATLHGSLAGSYSVSTWAITDDTLTVNLEPIFAEHVYDFERVLNSFDLFADRIDNQSYAIAWAIDKYVVNKLCDTATGSYSTPSGGFTQANSPIIISNLISKVAGYADAYKGLFLVVENTDVPGLIQAQMASGFSYADAALNNGLISNYAGVDIYVIRTGTFVTATFGDTAFTNSGHRVFGVKGVSTYAAPRGIQYEEKMVTGKTGREIVTYAYCGFKLWTQKASLVVDITLA
jgi:hypothetical protein